MSLSIVTSYIGTPNLGGNVFVAINDSVTNAPLVARTNVGIVERQSGNPAGASGFYVWHGTVPDGSVPDAIWDENGAPSNAGEAIVIIPPSVYSTTSPPPIVIPNLGPVASPGEFWYKRHDNRRILYYQAQEIVTTVSGSTVQPIDLTTVSGILFKMRLQPNSGSLKINKPATVVTGSGMAVNGWMQYVPSADFSDFDTTGDYLFEFQLTFNDGRVQTVPVTTDKSREFGILHVVDDLD